MDEVRARELMEDFAERTGLEGDGPSTRYLWTDSFAVCNFLGLADATNNAWYTRKAEALVDGVHHTLGRHREDDEREGWISGLEGEEAEDHPTRGGLRIGKPNPERGPQDPFDEQGEWDRDGQYFHYLTRWMYALDRMARDRESTKYNRWARELAETAVEAFVYRPGGEEVDPRMVWKMSISLNRPLVRSMGQHDPLDGYVTCRHLEATARQFPEAPEQPDLSEEREMLRRMFAHTEWATTDPLGLGGLLMDATRIRLLGEGGDSDDEQLLEEIVEAAVRGLDEYTSRRPWDQSVQRRMPFRELGLAIGMAGVAGAGLTDQFGELAEYESVGEHFTDYWKEPAHRDVGTWREWRDINEVMLATALVPAGLFDGVGR